MNLFKKLIIFLIISKGSKAESIWVSRYFYQKLIFVNKKININSKIKDRIKEKII